MSNTVFSVLLSFALVTVLGSFIAYNLQHRNWIRQQEVSDHEKKVADLKSIFFDLDTIFSKRLYWTRRLLYSVRRYNKEQLAHAVTEYDKAITEWNEKRNSFQIRLAAVVGVSSWQEFEHFIARRYFEIGRELEKFVRQARADNAAPKSVRRLNEIERELNALSHSVYDFARAIYNAIDRTERDFYSLARQKRLPRNEDELSFVSTWFLIKALFVPMRKSSEEF